MNGYLREIRQNQAMRKAIGDALAALERGVSPAIAESILRLTATEIDAQNNARRQQAADRVTDIWKKETAR